jgi:hypothetical protein
MEVKMDVILYLVAFFVLLGAIIATRKIRESRKAEKLVKRKADQESAKIQPLKTNSQDNTIDCLKLIYSVDPKKISESKAGHDTTKLTIEQLTLVMSFYRQYYEQKKDSADQPVTLFATNNVGETFTLKVTTKQDIADILNRIFGLTKNQRTYSRIYSKRS